MSNNRISTHIQNPVKISKMECLTKWANSFQPLFFAKHSILDVWQGSEYASGLLKLLCHGS